MQSEDAPDAEVQAKLARRLQDDVATLINNPEFAGWLRDNTSPSRFRGAGHFWDIAPGTPAETVYQRVSDVDRVLDEAERVLDATGENAIASQRGKQLFDRTDMARCREFQRVLKSRFARELHTLDPDHVYQ